MAAVTDPDERLADRVGDVLTAREREVLHYAADGWTNAEIAAQLSLSTHTVKEYLRRIRAGLGARDRTNAVHLAWQRGVLRATGSVGGRLVVPSRESQVLQGLAEGLSYEEIGERLLVAPATVAATAVRLYRRLGVSGVNAAQHAVHVAYQTGVLTAPCSRCGADGV